jgi:hypothetical protein
MRNSAKVRVDPNVIDFGLHWNAHMEHLVLGILGFHGLHALHALLASCCLARCLLARCLALLDRLLAGLHGHLECRLARLGHAVGGFPNLWDIKPCALEHSTASNNINATLYMYKGLLWNHGTSSLYTEHGAVAMSILWIYHAILILFVWGPNLMAQPPNLTPDQPAVRALGGPKWAQ